MSEKPKARERERAMPAPNAFCYSIADAQAMGAPGRTKIYELKKQGRLEFIKLDKRTKIVGDSLRKLLKAEVA